MQQLIAVETSDIVGSTKLDTDMLKHVLQSLNSLLLQYKASNDVFYEFYRGDAFQVTYLKPIHALRLALLTKLYLLSHFDKSIKVNQSIALGNIEVDKNTFDTESLSSRMDEVFIRSGRQLDKLSKGLLMVEPSKFDNSFALCSQFFNRIVANLSRKQALVLYTYINDDFPEQKKIAEKLNMTRQNVNTHLIRANADLIKSYIDLFESTCEGFKP